MKVLGVSGSARKAGNTRLLIERAFQPLTAAGHECEIVELAGKDVRGCTVCDRCVREADGRCYGRDDFGNEVIAKMISADAIILGSPTYYTDVSAEMKALIDRAGRTTGAAGNLLAHKPAAAVVAVRRAGALHAFDTMNHFFLIGEMIVVGSTYWNVGIGRARGEVEDDAEGMRTMQRLGENMAWVLEKLA